MASKYRISTYTELREVIEDLPIIVRETRRRRGLSVRAAGEECGFAYSLIAGIEKGHHRPRSDTLIILLKWLEQE